METVVDVKNRPSIDQGQLKASILVRNLLIIIRRHVYDFAEEPRILIIGHIQAFRSVEIEVMRSSLFQLQLNLLHSVWDTGLVQQ